MTRVDKAAVDRWLQAYVEAWKTCDREEISALFDDDVAVATGTSTYLAKPGGPVEKVFDNCFVIRFDRDGRCTEFTEWFMERP